MSVPMMTPPWVQMIQAHADQAQRTPRRGRRAGDPIGWPAELVRARDRNAARRTPTHRKEEQ